MSRTKISVLIIDDSAAMRQLLTAILTSDPQIEVVGSAADPFIARDKIESLNPDVLTLDVEMPRMDGLTFLEKLMRGRPMPVVMVSTLTQRGCDITMRALELGAVDFFSKPTVDTLAGVGDAAREIIGKVKAAARARVTRPSAPPPALERQPVAQTSPAGQVDERANRIPTGHDIASAAAPSRPSGAASFRLTHQVIAIGASTGGTEAIREVLCGMPPDSPGIVITQHMPPGFTKSFAERLNGLCALSVTEASDNDRVLQGHVLIAPGNYHMELIRSGAEYRVRIHQGERVNLHRPSVDVLFGSCAALAGKNAIGVLLTGMGDDGARGLKSMRDAGARTIAQDEASCVVFGMPREAIELGAAEIVTGLRDIPSKLVALRR